MKNILFFAMLFLAACTNRPTVQQAPTGNQFNISGVVTLSPLGGSDTVIVPPPVVPPTISGAFELGINTHPWIKPELLGEIKLHRHYLSSYYFWIGKGGKIKPQPMMQAGTPTAWGLDDILKNAKASGSEVLFAIHQTPTWLINQNRGDGGGDYPPISEGLSRTDTNSYREYSLMLRQITMRYGRIKYDDSKLNVDLSARWTGDANEKKSGLALLKYIQFWNEEKIWKLGTPEYIAPEEMAAMMSICYDAIKNTDPSMVVVSPCLSNIYMPYFKAMDKWFVENRRNKKWPCDIISCNYYLNKGNADGQFLGQWIMSGGCLPAEDKGFFRVKQLVDFAQSKSMRLWITETGYDDEFATQSQMQILGSETVRANALIATAEAMRSAGVEKVFFFSAADEYNAGKTLYQRSGIMRGQETGYAKKPSFALVSNYAKSIRPLAQPAEAVDRSKVFAVPPK